jgi:adenine-specific DNA-methyltransferase
MSGVMRSVDKARDLLKQLFRTKNADLDFGIYRIMNFKRAEIERFIDQDLIEAAEVEFKEFARAGSAELERELERRKREINDFVPGTIWEDWKVLKNHDLPKVKEFLGVLEEYRAASVSEEQVQDVFNHVYEFFSRYYEDGNFIPRTRYGARDTYYVPYNGEEVLLHWATKDMYYVKTGEYFNKYSFRAGRFRVTFKLVEAQIEQGNVKGDKKFFILHNEDPVSFDEASGEAEIRFNYRALTDEEKEKYSSRKTQDDLIDETLIKIGTSVGVSSISGILIPRGDEEKSLMRTHLEAYVERNTKDFFIHKNIKGFLERELDFYLKNEVWNLNELNVISDSREKMIAAKLKAIRNISSKIIEFINQIEVFQKKLFLKKKFILSSDYIISLKTLKQIISNEDYDKIRSIVIKNLQENKNYYEDIVNTIKEVYKRPLQNVYVNNVIFKDKEFYLTYTKLSNELTDFSEKKLSDFEGFETDSDENKTDIYTSETLLNKLNIDSVYIDTRYFNRNIKDEMLDIITKKENLDDVINGYLLKSDNIHALNLIYHKYKEKINLIYIDPPFNTKNSGFLYLDNYLDSSWLSMMYDRILLSKDFLIDDGSFYLHLDHNAYYYGRVLMNSIYGPDNFQREITWNTSRVISGFKTRADNWIRQHDTILYYSKSIKPKYRKIWNLYKESDENAQKILGWLDFIGDDKNELYIEKYEKNNVNISKIKIANYSVMRIGDVWNDILSLIYTQIMTRENWSFFTQKPENLLRRIIQSSTDPNDFVMDFYSGSGTTIASAHKLNRRWIGIEMGDHFENIMITRMKTVMLGDVRPFLSRDLNWNGGGFLQYLLLEQYEDTLNNIELIQSDRSIQSRLDRLPDYFLTYMLDYETKDSPTRISFEQFKTPFNYRIKTISGGEEREEPVDLVETFNYLLGLHVNRLRAFKDGDRLYRVVYGTRGNEQVIVIWRDTPDLDLKREKEFIKNTVLSDYKPDTIYINGDSYLENANPIEPVFKRLMGA